MYTKNQLLFPHQIIAELRDLRGADWRVLVDRVVAVAEGAPESLAFVLMMVRLNGCLVCETDSFRAMRGCDACSAQTLRRYKGSDQELLVQYAQALDDVNHYLAKTTSVSAAGAA